MLKLGVFFVISGLAGVTVYATTDGPPVGDTDTYHADFTDVSGLRVGDTVKAAGVAVGTVESIELRGATHADVEFTANHDQRLTSTTFAVVRYANLLGQRFLALTQSGTPGATLAPGATIPRARTRPAVSLTLLFDGFRPLFRALDAKQINTFSTEIIHILQGEGGTIENLLSQTAQLTGTFAQRDQLIVGIIDNLRTLLGTVAGHDEQVRQIVDSLSTFTHGLAADSPGIGRSLVSVDRLAGSLRTLVTGLNDHDIHGTVIDVEHITSVLAQNSVVLDRTVRAFPVAFADLNRITQDGNWIGAYACGLATKIAGQPSVSLPQVAQAIAAFLGDQAPSLATIVTLLGGLLPGGAAPLPLTIPDGPLTASPATNSRVCRR